MNNQATTLQKSDVKKRVQTLVARHGPLELLHLPQVYQKTFGEGLDCKFVDYDKLKSFV